jgi:deoxyribodipyrimidine photo-lyase
MRFRVRKERVHSLREGLSGSGPVVYWMSRDQRARDNWALLFARETALDAGRPVIVAFCLAPSFLGATLRQYDFMLRGLEETAAVLEEKNIPFLLLAGKAQEEVPRLVRRVKAHSLVADFDPLRIKRKWRAQVAREVSVPFFEVDAHNIVPCRIASGKQEYAARTLRPRLKKRLGECLEPFPVLRRHPHTWEGKEDGVGWDGVRRRVKADASVPPVARPLPGEKAALAAMRRFLGGRLDRYPEERNDPSRDGQSGLSPYLHFGQLSPQRVALEVEKSAARREAKDAFLEELVVRRELAENFCWYQEDYDTTAGFPEWALRTLAGQRRRRVYTERDLEGGEAEDRLWNAAQREMVHTGRMHGYLRMYWGKKILEWSASPEEALSVAIRLNDRYQLDGRDPNGYAGIAWCIGGVHDRPWPRRPLFGTVRSMTLEGCRRKFDVDAYIRRVEKMRSPGGGVPPSAGS